MRTCEPRILTRRGFIAGLASALAAPAIVRVDAIMPVRNPFWRECWVLSPGSAIHGLEGIYRFTCPDIGEDYVQTYMRDAGVQTKATVFLNAGAQWPWRVERIA